MGLDLHQMHSQRHTHTPSWMPDTTCPCIPFYLAEDLHAHTKGI